MCYLLREMGFSCLAVSARGFGYSGQSKKHPHMETWGFDDFLDGLGAWDFAVNDPDNALTDAENMTEGPMDPSQVGIMGFSKGAFTASIAFGLEKRIPAAWIDSGPFQGIEGVMSSFIDDFIPPGLNPARGALAHLLMWWMNRQSHVENFKYYPSKALKEQCDTTTQPRPVLVAHDQLDKGVPPASSAALVQFLGGLPRCFSAFTYNAYGNCAGDAHHEEMWMNPETTRQKACAFWSHAFKRNASLCRLADMPTYPLMVNVRSPIGETFPVINWAGYVFFVFITASLCILCFLNAYFYWLRTACRKLFGCWGRCLVSFELRFEHSIHCVHDWFEPCWARCTSCLSNCRARCTSCCSGSA